MTMPENVSVVRWPLLKWQAELRERCIREKTKTVMLCCGARSGKDYFARMFVMETALRLSYERQKDGSQLVPRVNIWVVAPERKLFMDHWHNFVEMFPPGFARPHRAESYIDFPGGIVVHFLSSAKPESLVSQGVDFLIYTEATRDRNGNIAWHESLVPRLASAGRYGMSIITGTPWLRHGSKTSWAKELFFDIKSGKKSGIALNYPTTVNPLMADKIHFLRENMTEKQFLAEIMAQWIDPSECGVFPEAKLQQSIIKIPVSSSQRKITGIDPARSVDDTAIVTIAIDDNGVFHVIDVELFTGLDVSSQISRIIDHVKRHNSYVAIDRTGVGLTFEDELCRLLGKKRVTGMHFTADLKARLVNNLSVVLDNGKLAINKYYLNNIQVESLLDSMTNYDFDIDDNGKVTFGGERDDACTALMLAVYLGALRSSRRPTFSSDRFSIWRLFG